MSDCGYNETLSGKVRLCSAKHDILYSKARYVLNQRHIKRPWFNLNPFLEKTDETIDLENFIPEESRYIQRLESMVLCETFTSELPIDTRETSIGDFFTYLYSGAWDHGCSIRVLEGQLLDELLLGLYRLERLDVSVRHTTHAIARNNRPRKGIYKHANKKEHGSIAETLLLEFAYFGLLTKDRPNPKTIDPFEYLHKSAVVERGPDGEEPAIEEQSSTAVLPKLTAIPKLRGRALSMVSPERIRKVNLSAPVEENTKSLWGLMTKPLQAIAIVNAFKSNRQSVPERDLTSAHGKRQSIAAPQSAFPQLSFEKCNHDKRQSIAVPQSTFPQRSFEKCNHDKRQSIAVPQSTFPQRSFEKCNHDKRQSIAVPQSPFLTRNHDKRNSVATASIRFDKRLSMQSPISGMGLIIENRKDPNLDRLKKNSDKPSDISPDFDEDDEELYMEKDIQDLLTPTEQAERDNFFGEELYLSDKRLHGDKQTKNMDTKTILRLKKRELKERRLEAKEAIKRETTRCKPVTLPPMPPRDPIHTPSLSNLKHETIKLPEKMPTLEEFIELLKEDEYYDPRYRNKIRLKGRRIAQRYYITKGMHRTSVLFSLANMPEEKINIGCRKFSKGPDMLTRTHHHSKPNISRLPKLDEAKSGHCLASRSVTKTSDHSVPKLTRSRGALEVLGVTDSVPCKDFYREFREIPESQEGKGSPEKMKGSGSKLRTGHSSATAITGNSSSHHRLKKLQEDKLNASRRQIQSPDVNAQNLKNSGSPVKFPKIAISTEDSEEEAYDPSEDEEEESEEESAFNTHKLKVNYSVERLRKRRKSKKPKKQAFIEILAKYYKLQNALRLFKKGSVTGEVKRAKVRAKKIGQTEAERKKEEETVIGRLRQFDFNIDTDFSRPHRKLNLNHVSRADFSRPICKTSMCS